MKKSAGYLLLLLGVLFFLSALSGLAANFVNSVEGYVLLYAVMIVGIVIGFLGFQIIMSPDIEGNTFPAHVNEYELLCEKCGKVIPVDATMCPFCGNLII
jgi:hypothetical protein